MIYISDPYATIKSKVLARNKENAYGNDHLIKHQSYWTDFYIQAICKVGLSDI